MPNARLIAALVLTTGAVAGTSAGQPSAAAATQDFVAAAAQSDHYEILAGRVAVTESRNARVRAFAQQMIHDHTAASQTLQRATRRAGLAPPPMGLSDDGQKFLSQLQSLSGLAFDKAYARQQVLAHQQALVVEQGYATAGSDPNIRRAATSTVPLIQDHLAMAIRMNSTKDAS